MDEFFSKDSLSAYLDGEMSPDERARIEDRLRRQPELQRELDQIRQASELVQDLDGPAAPTEFRALVMHRIEREMLLGPPPTPVPAGHPSRRRTRWIYGGGALAVAATLLITVAYFAGQFAGPGRPEGAVIALNDRFPQPSKSTSPRSDVSIEQPVEAKTASKELADFGQATSSARLPSAPMSAPVPATDSAVTSGQSAGVAKSLGAGPQSQLVFRKEELREAEIGDVVKAFEHVEGKAWVVYLTVVDRAEGLQGFQRALTRNSIMQQPQKPAEFDKVVNSQAGNANEFSERVRSHKAGDLECVYVEAPGEKLAAALQELRAEVQISELRVEAALSLAQLDDRSGNQLLAGRSFGGRETAPARDESDSGKGAASATSDEKHGNGQGKKEAEGSSKGDSRAKKPSLVQNAPTDAPAKQESAKPARESAEHDQTADSKTARRSVVSGKGFFDGDGIARQVQVTLPGNALGFALDEEAVRVDGDADRNAGEQPQSIERQPVVASRPRARSNSQVIAEFGAEAEQNKDLSIEKERTRVQVLFVLIDGKTGKSLPSATPPAAAPMKKAREKAPGDKHDDGAAS